MISYKMAVLCDGLCPPIPNSSQTDPLELKELLRAEQLPMASEVSIELWFEGRVFAHCVTIVAEVLTWDIERSALPRPTLSSLTHGAAVNPLTDLPLMETAFS
ncbi:MAG: hypothetical protein WA908_02110 [Pontixanthobacter sp.]